MIFRRRERDPARQKVERFEGWWKSDAASPFPNVGGKSEWDSFASGDSEIELFATESANRVYVAYRIVMSGEDAADMGRTDVKLTLVGDATLDAEAMSLVEVRPDRETLTCVDQNGEPQRRGIVFMKALFSGAGLVSVQHSVRPPLD